MKCPHCESELTDDVIFCPACGNTLPVPDAVASASPDMPGSVQPEPKQSLRSRLFGNRPPAPSDTAPQQTPEPPELPPAPLPEQQIPEQPEPEQLESARPVAPIKPVGVFSWLGSLLLLTIPVLGIVMIFRWASSKRVNASKRNFAIAMLLLWGILLALFITICILVPAFWDWVLGVLAALVLVG